MHPADHIEQLIFHYMQNTLLNFTDFFFVLRYLDDKIMQKCLHGEATDVGFNKLISLEELTDASNGYVINDTCVFGAEVFVRKERRAGKGTCISMIKNAAKYTHVWKIKKCSKLKDECYYSKPFTAGNQR